MISENREKIKQLLFDRFNTSFEVSYSGFWWEIFPTDTLKLAERLEVDAYSDDFLSDVDKIEVAINTLF
jgi:hypothetical protein